MAERPERATLTTQIVIAVLGVLGGGGAGVAGHAIASSNSQPAPAPPPVPVICQVSSAPDPEIARRIDGMEKRTKTVEDKQAAQDVVAAHNEEKLDRALTGIARIESYFKFPRGIH